MESSMSASLHFSRSKSPLQIEVRERELSGEIYYAVIVDCDSNGATFFLSPIQFHQMAVDIATLDYKLNPSRFIPPVEDLSATS